MRALVIRKLVGHGGSICLGLAVLAIHPVLMRETGFRDGTAALAQTVSPETIAEYRRQLSLYQQARAEYEEEASAYWNAIADKRRLRNAKRRDRLRRSRCDGTAQDRGTTSRGSPDGCDRPAHRWTGA